MHEADLDKIISDLKGKKSSGVDNISTKLLKSIYPAIKKPLLHLLNLSMTTGIFPEAMKLAKVVPIHKKDNKQDFRNYRPISLLSAFSKVFEKCVSNKLSTFSITLNMDSKKIVQLNSRLWIS